MRHWDDTLLSSVLGGLVASAIFKQVWRRATPGEKSDPPTALETSYLFKQILSQHSEASWQQDDSLKANAGSSESDSPATPWRRRDRILDGRRRLLA
jgi:hypothetical protein